MHLKPYSPFLTLAISLSTTALCVTLLIFDAWGRNFSEWLFWLAPLLALGLGTFFSFQFFLLSKDARRAATEATRRVSMEQVNARVADILNQGLVLDDLMQSILHLIVPDYADWCSIRLLDSQGKLSIANCAHRESGKEALLRKLDVQFSLPEEFLIGPGRVFAQNSFQFIPRVNIEEIKNISRDAYDLIVQIGVSSYICLPLMSRGKNIGTISFGVTKKIREFSRYDLRLFQLLAPRFALGIDHCLLFEDLKKASSAKDEFLAILSHELRTPLAAIMGWLDLIKNWSLDRNEFDEALEGLESSARIEEQHIEDLLDISRITAGKLSMDFERVNLENVVVTAFHAVKFQAQEKNILLESQWQGPKMEVLGDARRLSQVLLNLLNNAIKFTPKGGHVTLTVKQEESNVSLEVSDNGRGIPADFLPHIFEKFKQQDSSTTRKYGGLGLGLAIAKQISDLHRGELRAESGGLGRGSKFTLRLPLLDSKVLAEHIGRRGHDPLAQNCLSRAKILIVEDVPELRIVYQKILSRYGAEVMGVENAEAALKTLESSGYDLLISDIGLDGIDGYELLKRIREGGSVNANIPAIALTGFAAVEDEARAFGAGFRAHIAKPVRFDAFVETAVQAINGIHRHEPPLGVS